VLIRIKTKTAPNFSGTAYLLKQLIRFEPTILSLRKISFNHASMNGLAQKINVMCTKAHVMINEPVYFHL